MRPKLATGLVLLVAVLALALATPAAAGQHVSRSCKVVSAEMQTYWFPDEGVEMGWVAGTIDGGAYFKYDDVVPPIEPPLDKPNLMLAAKEGTIYLWMSGESTFDDDGVTRKLATLWAEGTGIYANTRITVNVEGKFLTDKGGNYRLLGWICPPRPTPTS